MHGMLVKTLFGSFHLRRAAGLLDRRCAALLVLIVSTTALSHRAEALPAVALSPPTSSKVITGSADWNQAQQVSNGYLVSFTKDSVGYSDITLTSLVSGEESNVSFDVDGIAPIISGAAVIGRDRMAVTGIFTKQRGADGAIVDAMTRAFLAYADLEGRVTSVIDLGFFVPKGICATANGTTWVLGQDAEKEGQVWLNDTVQPNGPTDYALLRAYSAEGTLIKSSLRRSELPVKTDLYWNLAAGTSTALACSADTVGVYIDSPLATQPEQASAPLWIEARATENTVQRWEVSGVPAGATLSGLALPFSNTVYSSFRSRERLGLMSGVYTLALGNNGMAKWIASTVRNSSGESTIAKLKVLGSDGASLVYINGTATAATVAPVVNWSPTDRLQPLDTAIAPKPLAAAVTPVPLTEAGDVQHYVDDADAIIRYYTAMSAFFIKNTKYSAFCWSSACTSALASLTSAVATWKATKDHKDSRSLALAVTTKETIHTQESAFSAAIKAQALASYPLKPTGGGGGHGGGCGAVGPNGKNQPDNSKCLVPPEQDEVGDYKWAARRTVALHGDSTANRHVFPISLYHSGALIQVLSQSCQFLCANGNAAVLAAGVCIIGYGLLIATIPASAVAAAAASISGFTSAFGCYVADKLVTNICNTECPPDPVQCTTDGNYNKTRFPEDRRRSYRRAIPLQPNRVKADGRVTV